ncbi:hypothetical protein GF324_08015, partial [bacterium]|nr:hypothetical protein [bacterium]
SLFNVHAVRSPASGVVASAAHHPGKFHPAFKPEAGRENEHVRLEIETDHGPVVLYTMAGFLTRRVINHAEQGDTVRAGERIGFVRFGSRAEVMFPPGFVPSIHVDEKVVGGVTELGAFDTTETGRSTPNDEGEVSLLSRDRAATLPGTIALRLQQYLGRRLPALDRWIDRKGRRREA